MRTVVASLIDNAPIRGFHVRIVAICALVTLLDGLDIQAMSIVLPQVAKEWGTDAQALGPVLSATFAGIAIGAVLFGLLGDRYGRKLVISIAFALVGAATLAATLAHSPGELFVLRLLAGLGIGGALPNATALTAEYVPARKRVLLVSLMYCGVPAGSALVAFVGPPLINAFGWRSVFALGGLLPLLLLPLTIFLLPESIRFLVNRTNRQDKATAILKRIDPAYIHRDGDELVVTPPPAGLPVGQLFANGRVAVTVPLWVIFFGSFFGFYIITSWLPVIFAQADWPKTVAIRTITAFQIGTIVGALLCGWLVDRIRAFVVLGVFYGIACVLVLTVGAYHQSIGLTMALMVLAGLTFGGAQVCIVAVAAEIYPGEVRATGVGWALGAGRIGAVVSPTIAGYAIAAKWSTQGVLMLAAVPAAICVLACIALIWRGVTGEADAAQVPGDALAGV